MTEFIISDLPPLISQHFNKDLLSLPCPKFNDDVSRIDRIFKYFERKLLKKCKDEYQRKEIEELLKIYREKHERIVKKEKELKAKTSHKTKDPFYRFKIPSKFDGLIFDRLRWK